MNGIFKKSILFVIGIIALVYSYKVGYRNVDATKLAASRTWGDMGYKVVGYEGYQWGPVSGGYVWYLLEKTEHNGILYQGALAKWKNEYHIYSLSAIDAIKSK